MKVRWTPLAVAKAEEITDYIGHDKPGAARRWLREIFAAADSLPQSPHRGRVVPEIGRDAIRELLLGSFRLIYRIDEDGVAILTIRHGRQLLDTSEIL